MLIHRIIFLVICYLPAAVPAVFVGDGLFTPSRNPQGLPQLFMRIDHGRG